MSRSSEPRTKTLRPYRLLVDGSAWCLNTFATEESALTSVARAVPRGKHWRLYFRQKGQPDKLVAEGSSA